LQFGNAVNPFGSRGGGGSKVSFYFCSCLSRLALHNDVEDPTTFITPELQILAKLLTPMNNLTVAEKGAQCFQHLFDPVLIEIQLHLVNAALTDDTITSSREIIKEAEFQLESYERHQFNSTTN
jgi:hypothetical protein